MSGLNRKHHGELNRGGVSRARFAELRKAYRGDRKAQRQIDMYDGESEYNVWFRKYRDALLANDQVTQRQCETWFKKHGYDNI